ncbi:MAG: hypothetical protein JNM56_01765 [Planctomycetia bacterium]|nr:hypothetical protein [Planctomycetia bacterium]
MKRFLGAAVLVPLLWTALRSAPPPGELKIGEPRTVATGPTLALPRAAFGDGVYLVVWQDGWTGLDATADIKGLRLKAGSLEPLDREPLTICSAAEAQEAPAVAYANGVFLLVWQDFRNGKDYDIRGAVVDAKSGQVRAGDLELAVRPGSQARPAVASDGKTFFVVWQEARGEVHGIRGVRVSTAGKVLDETPHTYAETGTSPALAISANKALVAWALKERTSGRTAAALIDLASGQKVREVGIINTCCGDRPAVADDGQDGFVTAAGRASAPDPWGWGGPGAVVLSRVQADGTTPESKLNYAYRLSNLCSRSVPNVVDAAVWKGAKTWEAGAVGGFPGTEDSLWPTGWQAVVHDGRGGYLFAWVKGTIARDRLNLSNLDVWVRGMDAQSLAVRVADRQAAATSADETRPALVNGPAGEILLLNERLQSGEPRRIEARRLDLPR